MRRYHTIFVTMLDICGALNAQYNAVQVWPCNERKIAVHVLDCIALAMNIDVIESQRSKMIYQDGASWSH